jgi:hypothetical protein
VQTYLGIQIFRFYFKCTKCSAEITFKTDPQNSDYMVESGASRNFEPWREQDEVSDLEAYSKGDIFFFASIFFFSLCDMILDLITILCVCFVQLADKEKRKRDSEEMGDAMKVLENRAMDSKQDMDILAALEEMRSMRV